MIYFSYPDAEREFGCDRANARSAGEEQRTEAYTVEALRFLLSCYPIPPLQIQVKM